MQRGKVPSDVAVFQGNGISPMTPWWLNSVRDVAAFGVFIIYQQAQSEVVLLAFFFFPFYPHFPHLKQQVLRLLRLRAGYFVPPAL